MRPIYDAKFRGEICKRMSPPSRETVTEISRATGISRQTLYSWRHLWKRERGLYPQQLAQWRQAAEYANGLDAPSMADRNYRKRKRHFGLAVHAVQRIC